MARPAVARLEREACSFADSKFVHSQAVSIR